MSCIYRVYACVRQRQTLTIYHVHVLCAYPRVCESVSLFGHCVIFHLPHTHAPLRFSPSFSHSSLTSPRIYYARILRAACSNLLLYCCLPWGRVRRGNWVFMRRWLLHISLSRSHARTHTHRAVWHAVLMCLALAISFWSCFCFARFARMIIKAFSICSWNL